MKKVKTYSRLFNSEILLISLLVLLFVPPMLRFLDLSDLVFNLALLLVAISGYQLIYVSAKSLLLKVVYWVLIVLSLLDFLKIFEEVSMIFSVVWVVFFLKVFHQIFKHSLDVNYPAKQALVNSISGYIVLGIIGSIFFSLLNWVNPFSFNHPVDQSQMVYFSFVTMSTLGYGDITPVSSKAQSLAVVLTIAGQIYLAVVIALNLAKYMSMLTTKKKKKEK